MDTKQKPKRYTEGEGETTPTTAPMSELMHRLSELPPLAGAHSRVATPEGRGTTPTITPTPLSEGGLE